MKLDHIGYLVKDISNSLETFKLLNTIIKLSEIIKDDSQDVDLMFIKVDSAIIELVSPHSNNLRLISLLEKSGPGSYHFCYQSENLDKDVNFLISNNFFLIQSPSKAKAFGMRRIVFLYNINVGLIELVENEAGDKIL